MWGHILLYLIIQILAGSSLGRIYQKSIGNDGACIEEAVHLFRCPDVYKRGIDYIVNPQSCNILHVCYKGSEIGRKCCPFGEIYDLQQKKCRNAEAETDLQLQCSNRFCITSPYLEMCNYKFHVNQINPAEIKECPTATIPPTSIGDTTTPSVSVGDTTTPSVSVGDTTTPSVSVGDTTTPSVSVGDTTTPSVSGGDTTTPPTVVTTYSPNTTPIIVTPPATCSDSDENKYFYDPDDPKGYYFCSHGELKHGECPGLTYFDCINLTCVMPESITGCPNIPSLRSYQ